MADFHLVATRTLDEFHLRIFRYHFLLGADWRLCCRKLNMERGNFFHAVYRLQQQLGLVFKELKPYPLFPTDEYFGGTIRKTLPGAVAESRAKVIQMPSPSKAKPLVPPLRQPKVA
jgi:hypothetical protein